jgi:hypothetical protein
MLAPISVFALLFAVVLPPAQPDEPPRPAGWYLTGGGAGLYVVDVDTSRSHDGDASCRLRPRPDLETCAGAAIEQIVEAGAFKGHRVRLTAWVSTLDVACAAGIWLRVDEPNAHHDQPDRYEEQLGWRGVVLDNTMFRQPLSGTSDWTKETIVLDVSPTAIGLGFGGVMSGPGTTWFDTFRLEVVDASVPTTNPEWDLRFDRPARLPLPTDLTFDTPSPEAPRIPAGPVPAPH